MVHSILLKQKFLHFIILILWHYIFVKIPHAKHMTMHGKENSKKNNLNRNNPLIMALRRHFFAIVLLTYPKKEENSCTEQGLRHWRRRKPLFTPIEWSVLHSLLGHHT